MLVHMRVKGGLPAGRTLPTLDCEASALPADTETAQPDESATTSTGPKPAVLESG